MKDIANTQYYVFAAKNIPWPNAPTPNPITLSVTEDHYTIYEEMIFGKLLTPSNVSLMANRYNWTTGTVYAQYDDQDPNLPYENFYVVTSEAGAYNVFKCLNNNNGAISTAQPLLSQTSVSDSYYITSDGYQWKYLYTIPATTFNTFATSTYIPVIPNPYVQQYASNGAIDSIIVSSGGNNYIATLTGKFSLVGTNIPVLNAPNAYQLQANVAASNSNFYNGSSMYLLSGTGAGQIQPITGYIMNPLTPYVAQTASAFYPQPDSTTTFYIGPSVNISGDGSGAQAYAVVNTASLTVQRIDVINGGSNYTYANVLINGNTGMTAAASNTATARAIISPPGGHGANVYNELYANKVGIGITFSNNENSTISSNNQYCRVGILKGPQYANVIINTATNPGFSVGETVVQIYSANNPSMTTTTGSVTSYVYNCGNYITVSVPSTTPFSPNTPVTQISSNPVANGYITYIANSTALIIRQDTGAFSNQSGTFANTANLLQTTAFTYVNSAFSTAVYGVDSTGKTLATNTTIVIDAFLNNSRLINRAIVPSTSNVRSYTYSSNTLTLFNYTLGSDIVNINVYTPISIITNSQYTTTATVTAQGGNQLDLTNVSGPLIPGASVYGLSSGVNSQMVSLAVGPVNTFDQTLKVGGTYNNSSPAYFSLNDLAYQPSTGAYGYVEDFANSTPLNFTFRLTGVKGQFNQGLIYNNFNITAATKNFTVNNSIIQPDLIKYSGEIIYAENISPISRSLSQSESVQVVLQFF